VGTGSGVLVGSGVSVGRGVGVGSRVSVRTGGGVAAGEEQEISRIKQNAGSRMWVAMFLCIRSILTEIRLLHHKRNNLIQSSC
jgi:hypothetical protein